MDSIRDSIRRVAFIGNSLPRRCGIATFTSDLRNAVAESRPEVDTFIVAMTDRDGGYAYPPTVLFDLPERDRAGYAAAADRINRSGADVVSLQHEFGIFGGPAGAYLGELIDRLEMPLVTTLHTVLAEPDAAQREMMERLSARSSRLVVMARKGRDLLKSVYGVPTGQIDVIPHGIPDIAFVGSGEAKRRLGFGDRPVILTFGLLSPNKGIELMLEAMPAILKASPSAVYVVLGATHPNLVRDHGEAYRDSLKARVRALGIEGSVVFVDRFFDQATLLQYISMCDVYVTPYLNEAQMTSGTLSYSFGLGKPVVSTPYWHAAELLANGDGILVPFGDSRALGDEVASLLTDEARRRDVSARAYRRSRSMTWGQTAQRYFEVFASVTRERALGSKAVALRSTPPQQRETAEGDIRLDHLLALSDDTGIAQHACLAIADRNHGYCIDDNARALLLAVTGGRLVPEPLTRRYAAFVHHAFNAETGRFRNFMGYDRRWLEEAGSEDSHGRTLWALGQCVAADGDPLRRRWAEGLFAAALPAVRDFRSPRAWAFTLLGLAGYRQRIGSDGLARDLQRDFAARLEALFAAQSDEGWLWFEPTLSYDNARLPQALIVTGSMTGERLWVDCGLQALTWLMAVQTGRSGCFRPVGTRSFGLERRLGDAFDQQPVDAAASLSACLTAARVDGAGAARWQREARRAWGWFLGENDVGLPLVDAAAGSCCDGLEPDGVNGNRGAESLLAYLTSAVEMRAAGRREREVSAPLRGGS